MSWYITVLKKYAVFSGRARRKEFWMFALFNMIISLVLGSLAGISSVLAIISGIYFLAILLPGIAVSIRRLQDTNRSGWWLLLGFVPIASIVLLVFFFQEGSSEENKYGPNPKADAAAG